MALEDLMDAFFIIEVAKMKQRNISIDVLKCFAAIIITNSHMDILYPKLGALATGGAIGDALFFLLLLWIYSILG